MGWRHFREGARVEAIAPFAAFEHPQKTSAPAESCWEAKRSPCACPEAPGEPNAGMSWSWSFIWMLLGLDTPSADLCAHALDLWVRLEEGELRTAQELPKSPILCAPAGLEPGKALICIFSILTIVWFGA